MEREIHYLMESDEETLRLEMKTDRERVKTQAQWCGIGPGQRVLDLGCGTGKTTSIIHELVQPGGSVVGVDGSRERIAYAEKQYGAHEGIEFHSCDLTGLLEDLGEFDVIWMRFVLEYFRRESAGIVRNLKQCLKPGGVLCLLDLDHNCLNHYELSPRLEDILGKIIGTLERKYNFDPYAGRKLYSYLYDEGFEEIEAHIMAHHLIYGEVREEDAFNWVKKIEMVARAAGALFDTYPGGFEGFTGDFEEFFYDPRRFTYSCLILCKGRMPK